MKLPLIPMPLDTQDLMFPPLREENANSDLITVQGDLRCLGQDKDPAAAVGVEKCLS